MPLTDNLLSAWLFNEAGGSTSADSWTANNDATLVGTAALGSGLLTLVTTNADWATVSSFTLSGDWTICFRGKQATSGFAGIVCGNRASTDSFIAMFGGLAFRVALPGTNNDFSVTTFTTEKDYAVVYDATADTLTLYIDGTLIETKTGITNGSLTITAIGSGFSGDGFSLAGTLDYLYVWERALPEADVDAIDSDPDSLISSVTITSPVTRQVIQRTGAPSGIGGSASVTISGTYGGTPTVIQYSTNGSTWATLDAAPAGGTFSGTVSIAAGQYTLNVRFSNDTAITDSVALVGIGDVVGIYGQSNAAGSGDETQSYSHATLQASKYTGSWANLTDFGTGSPWPLLATHWMAYTGCPVAFLNYAVSGASITTLIPGEANYIAFTDAVDDAGGSLFCTLYWQGETDVIASMSQATYNGHLDTLANALATAYSGHFLNPCRLQENTTLSDSAEDAIRAAVDEAVADNANVKAGPDLSDIDADDGIHIQTTAKLETVAERWWDAIEATFASEPVDATRLSTIATRRLPWMRRFWPAPDGSMSQEDRQQLAFVYVGILAEESRNVLGWRVTKAQAFLPGARTAAAFSHGPKVAIAFIPGGKAAQVIT